MTADKRTLLFINLEYGDVYITQLPLQEAWENALSADPDRAHWVIDDMDREVIL